MRIKGYFDDEGSPFVDIMVGVNKGNLGKISFLIDTGIPRTIISRKDADKLGIKLSEMRKVNSLMLTLGGRSPSQIFKLSNLTFSFTAESSEYQKDIEEVFVNRNDHMPEFYRRQIPSVLGRDVLNRFRLTLDYNEGDGVVLLSSEE